MCQLGDYSLCFPNVSVKEERCTCELGPEAKIILNLLIILLEKERGH